MPKRFTDNEKWKDAWFMDLPSKYKLFWLYILDECNHAGVWKVNFKVSIFYIGEHLEYSEVKRVLKSRITILNDEYWYINKFIKYQYNLEIEELNYKNKVHLSVLKILNSYDDFKHLCSPLIGAKDKDKDKEKVIVKKEAVVKQKETIPLIKEFMLYAKSKLSDDDYKRKRDNLILKYDSWVEAGWKDGFNKPIKNWKSKLLNNLQFIQSKKI